MKKKFEPATYRLPNALETLSCYMPEAESADMQFAHCSPGM